MVINVFFMNLTFVSVANAGFFYCGLRKKTIICKRNKD